MGDVARFSINNEGTLFKVFGVNAEILIDHAWGYESVTIKDIKKYKPENKSLSIGQVLHEAYTFSKARIIVERIFKEQVDKAGEPYINHLYRVSDRLENYKDKVAGLLHDIIEDTEITSSDLIDIGFSKDIVDVVLLLSKDTSVINKSLDDKLNNYNEKIEKIIESKNLSAIRVKIADIEDNYDEDRLSKLSIEQREWFQKKYKKNLVKIKEMERKILC